ncbi:MAG: DNA internalization-related competence protein ComEC/Rec2, partial [Selenomonas sp.]|nr:DNA internalization-related competence protein ComEC/Rec2 [Selenomonas sp.]
MEIGQRQELFLASLLLALGTGIIAGRIWELSAGVMVVPLLTTVGMSFYGALRLRKWTWLAAVSAFFLLGILRFAAADELPVSDISYFAGET